MINFKKRKDQSTFNPEDLFKEAIIDIRKEKIKSVGKTADILVFAKEIIGVGLYPAQKIILKFLYKNSRFNENLEITEEDIENIKNWSIEQSWILYGENSKLNVVNNKKTIAKDLILVLGRRSGKSFLSSLISTYEAYKLLELKDPQKFYRIDSDIYIINTAVTKEQAVTQIFKQISKFINRCPYFSGRICKETEGKIILYTDSDLERIKSTGEGTGKSIEGSVIILSGTSNSPALRGHACLSPESLVLTENGLTRIEYFKNYIFDNFSLGLDLKKTKENILKVYGENGLRKPDYFLEKNDKINKIRFDTGSYIKCTNDHKIFIYNQESKINIKKEVKDIKPGDLILRKSFDKNIFNEKNYIFNIDYNKIPHFIKKENIEKCEICDKIFRQISNNHVLSHGISMKEYKEKFGSVNLNFYKNRARNKDIEIPNILDKKLARIIGYLISEGCLTVKNRLQFCNCDKDVFDDFCEKFENVFKKFPKISIRKQTGLKDLYTATIDNDAIKFFFSNIIGLGEKFSYEKIVPNCVLMSPKDIVLEFLRGLFEGDGIQTEQEVGYTSSSERLIQDLYCIFDNLGYDVHITERANKKYIIRGRTVNRRDKYYSLYMYGKYVDKYYKEIGFISKRRCEKKLDYKRLRFQERNVICYDKDVLKIKEDLLKLKSEKVLEKKDYKIYDLILTSFKAVIKNRQFNIDRSKIYDLEYLHKKYGFLSSCGLESLKSMSNLYLTVKEIFEVQENSKVYDLSFLSDDHSFIADGVLNHNCAAIIYDEMAHYFDTDGTSSAKEVYNALSRSTLTLSVKGDGRNIVISSPDRKYGFFYEHYEKGKNIETMQVFQIPTIDANPSLTEKEIHDEYLKDPVTASSEFGAQFRTVGGNSFFPPDKIDEAFQKRSNMYLSKKGIRGYEYYMHIDPATSSDNWAIMIIHPEWRWNNNSKCKECIVVEDYSCFWKPPVGGHLDENEIMDKHVLPLCKNFSLVSVTYDNMFSLPQRSKLNDRRIPNANISFSGRNKNNMYSTVKDLLIQGRLELCKDDFHLEGEMKAILVDYSGKYPTITKDRNNEQFPNDDLVDTLVGAAYRICQGATGQIKLPRSKAVFMGRR